jgi:glutamate synthase (NADPH/NADH) large chain
VNPESVVVQRLASPYWEGVLRSLTAEHAAETGSRLVSRLTHPLTEEGEAELA